MNIPVKKLSNGFSMPEYGLGTWQMGGRDERDPENYDRSKLFIASKVGSSHLGYKDVLEACKNSLERLQVDYLDLYLIHRYNPRISVKRKHAGTGRT